MTNAQARTRAEASRRRHEATCRAIVDLLW